MTGQQRQKKKEKIRDNQKRYTLRIEKIGRFTKCDHMHLYIVYAKTASQYSEIPI